MPQLPKILRGSLTTKISPGGTPGSFHLPCRKVVIEYCETNPSSKGTRDFLLSQCKDLAKRTPSTEFVVKQRPGKHPIVRGFYLNNRTKEISLQNLAATGVLPKVQLLLDSSGNKITSLKRRPVESVTESARGIWSALHDTGKDI
ncbi:hypothetical protein IE53DRAFT_162387 [Violaceomyces palustris]|uniref:Uncharacterized protein n=1 Tax=Violaceomyces palustris TaxID=1673888 RepID=A0ACD0NTF1_9BASI|nr:hypothetical protein IE53DRAFT_162387 [Violaceomyces palustris]